ncbi:LysE family translocator [Actinoplanes sp. CA-142083]|uniref:LysE family translocator n=1 Tax=Actinoplanes sp. CA-142083 TaxID=3239903 RepID=UPI003D92D55F
MTGRMLAFMLASLTLIAIPGPNMIFIVTRSATHGLRAGIASAFGVETGTLLQLTLVGAGLATLVAASPLAFAIIKYAGVGYLAYIGFRALHSARKGAAAVEAAPARQRRRLFLDGVLVSALNPKVALFFLAFLPQFVRSEGELPAFGAVFIALGLAADIASCFAANAIGRWLRVRSGGSRVVGSIYLGLGLFTAVSA